MKFKSKRFDPIGLANKIPMSPMRQIAMDALFTLSIPFNRWLFMHIDVFEPGRVVILSPSVPLRRNHVGGAHACALALLGEYAAGLCVAQNYSARDYRIIIGSLNIDYHKQGKGKLYGEALAPATWEDFSQEAGWVEMTTEIRNAKHEPVATCHTKWPVKRWDQVGRRTAPSHGGQA